MGRLGHYRVIRQLGMGGMGFVFEAEDIKLKRRVALKVMNQKIAATPGARQRFVTEARAMAAIHHDNVATIFEVGQRGDTPFMAMEMLSGQTVEQLNADVKKGKKSPLSYVEVIRLGQEMCWGLAAAHERGIVHRDIKPANLWIESRANRVKVLDFGLALAQTPTDSLAGRGSVIGTPGYLAPEQARGEPLDDRSDLYSLGVVLFELCTGELPIKSKSIHEQLIAILIQKPPAANEVNGEVPAPLSDTIAKLLRKEPRTRYNSAAELAAHFDEVRNQCERTSEVALTIDKLKSTIASVAMEPGETKPASSLDVMPSFDSLNQVDLGGLDNVFDEIPAAAAPILYDPLGGSSGSIPAVRFARPPVKPARPSKKSGDGGSRMNVYLPLAIVVGLILISLPIMTFMFSGLGRSTENTVIQPPRPFNAPENPAGQSTQRVAKTPISSPKSTKPKSTDLNKSESESKSGIKQGQPADSIANEGSTTTQNLKDKEVVGRVAVKTGSDVSPDSDPAKAMETTATPSEATPVDLPPAPEAEEVAKLRVRIISTGDDRGADAVVVRGTNENKGEAPAVAVQTRGEIPTRHSYLRFDLKPMGKERSKVKFARLVLQTIGEERPVGARLQLYAIDLKLLWPENVINWNNSYSDADLVDLTEVASMTVESDDENSRAIILGSDELATFIRESENETLTFVLAGKDGDKQVRFVSHERSKADAPRLQLAIADE